MTIAEMLREIVENGVEKTVLARRLGVSRQTLDHWLGGLYVPEPWDKRRRTKVAEVTGRPESYILFTILQQKGVEASELRSIGAYAKGLYLSSPAAA